MKLDIRRVIKGSLIFIGVGFIFVIISMILQLLTLIITDANAEIVQLIALGYSLLMVPVFLVMYVLAGMRAVKTNGLDPVGAGALAAFAYLVTSIIHLGFDFMLNLLVISGLIPGGAGFGSAGAVVSSQIFGGMVGFAGIGVAALCGFGLILVGTLINFVVGGVGGLIASK